MKPLKTLIALTATTLSLSCIYPVYDGDGLALEEQHSVWQYLKVFSIYHERLPAELGVLKPEDMFVLINDSLGNQRFTGYFDGRPGGGGGGDKPEFEEPLKISDSTIYIQISDFWEPDLEYFKAYVMYMSDFPNIIIDLKYNGGGLLNAVDSMISEFLPLGTEYIKTRHRVYDDNRLEGRTVTELTRTKLSNPKLRNKNIVILMNQWSASASEIMISGLKDQANATLVGSTTYGKGIGQYVFTRGGGRRGLRITFMEIEGIPDGKVGEYHKAGIPPDPVPPQIMDVADFFADFMCSTNEELECSDDKPEIREDLRDWLIAIMLIEPTFFSGEPAQKLTELAQAQKAQTKRTMMKRRSIPAGVIVINEDPFEGETQ